MLRQPGTLATVLGDAFWPLERAWKCHESIRPSLPDGKGLPPIYDRGINGSIGQLKWLAL